MTKKADGLIPLPDVPFFTMRIKYPEHPRIIALGRAEPKWLHTVALAQCNEHLTDGRIDPFRLKVICAVAEVTMAWVKRLVDAGLWIDNGDGHYEIRDFLEYNPSSEKVKELRQKRRDAGKKGGDAKAANQADAVASASGLLEQVPQQVLKQPASREEVDLEVEERPDALDLDLKRQMEIRQTIKSGLEA